MVISHLGHPFGWDPSLSMRPVADRLAQLTGAPVPLAPAVAGPQVREMTERLAPGAMLMLENVRFEQGEMQDEPALASALSELADLYVNDAFAVSHRACASTEGVSHLLPSAAGRLIEREVSALSALVEHPDQPLVAILGGARIGDKLDLMRRLLHEASALCIGGGMCFPFMAAQGHSLGATRCPAKDAETARITLAEAAESGCRLELPRDLVVGALSDTGRIEWRALNGVDVSTGWTGLDIGRMTAERYTAEIADAATVFWHGAMGRQEVPDFTDGTAAIAAAIGAAPAATVVAGEGSVEALRYRGSRTT